MAERFSFGADTRPSDGDVSRGGRCCNSNVHAHKSLISIAFSASALGLRLKCGGSRDRQNLPPNPAGFAATRQFLPPRATVWKIMVESGFTNSSIDLRHSQRQP
jgi:hypothetical protein